MSMAVAVEDWKRHVLECGLCSHAKSVSDVCPIGRTFWNLPETSGSVAVPVGTAPVANVVPVVEVKAQAIAVAVMPDARFIANMADRVTQSVVARSSTGVAVSVPKEKTSALIEVRTSPDVMLRMPERDIEIYGAMRNMIRRVAEFAEKLGKTVMVVEETKRHMRTVLNLKEAPEEQVSLVVQQVTSRFGTNEEDLFFDFEDLCRGLLNLGDKLGGFMRVDDDTRRVMQSLRAAGIEMKGELERSYDGKLPLDADMRKIIRLLRMLAMDLQGEIERRIGTC
jgi:hypothetical protein